MPNRIIREGWVDSERIDSLTREAEVFFLRLCLKSDDFGRYHGHTQLLKSNLFPLREDIRNADISRWLAECEATGLVRCYDADSKRFTQILRFNQRIRSDESKFPTPPDEVKQSMSVVCPSSDSHPRTEAEAEAETYSEAESKTKAECVGVDGSVSVPAAAASASPPLALVEFPSFEEVKKEGAVRGYPFPSVRSFYEYHENNNLWLNKFNRPIDWRKKLASWVAQDRQPTNGNSTNRNTSNNISSRRGGRSRTDGNAGTANEGKASQYAGMGKVV